MTINHKKSYSNIIHQHNFTQLPTADYHALLSQKTHYLKQLLHPFVCDDVQNNLCVFESPISHFRMRAEFGIWHEGNACFYTMIHKDAEGFQHRICITDFPTASEAINQLMQPLLEKLTANDVLKNKLFQVEFLSTLSGDMLVTLIYHKKLDEHWQALAHRLEKDLGIYIIGRSRKQKVVLSQDYVTEKLTVLHKNYTYKQLEGGFTQPNAIVCQHMLTWACQQASKLTNTKNHDLLELYCGNANFTLPLSQYFKRVLATEISKTSVAAAQWNIEKNAINNIAIARLSAEEFTQAQSGVREFRRLKQADIDLASYCFSTVFVDPPRAGIDDNTLNLLAGFEHIIYISCNPDTLANNLKQLCQTHHVSATALFDQFPYTHHIEAGVVLSKN